MKGRKRHLLVDTEGLVLRVVVHAADVQDRDGGRLVLSGLAAVLPRLQHLWVDAGYRGHFVGWVERSLQWSVEVVQHDWRRKVWQLASGELTDKPPGFQVLPRRWVVERTFAWLGKQRRLSKDYEALPATSEALIYATMSGYMLRRLANRTAR